MEQTRRRYKTLMKNNSLQLKYRTPLSRFEPSIRCLFMYYYADDVEDPFNLTFTYGQILANFLYGVTPFEYWTNDHPEHLNK